MAPLALYSAQLLLTALLATPAVHAQLGRPSNDSFYVAPTNISNYAPGQIVATRTITPLVGAAATQISYRTNGINNTAELAVGTVWAPTSDAPVLSPPRIVVFADAEDADNIDCSPSWAMVNGSSTNFTGMKFDASFVIPSSTQQKGYYVVMPDYQGPKSAWLVGAIEGQTTLDSARAIINHYGLKSKGIPQLAMFGYSGSAHAIAWAAGLAASYAPELNFTSAVYGGTPIDLLATYNSLNNGPNSGLAGGALWGLANGYPELKKYLNDSAVQPLGLQQRDYFYQNGTCLRNTTFNRYNNVNFTESFTPNIFAQGTPLQTIFANESLLNNTTPTLSVPLFPRFVYHGTSDEVIPYDPAVQYINQQCRDSNNQSLLTFQPYSGKGHFTAFLAGVLPALDFINSAFEGRLAKITCGQPYSYFS